MTDKNRLRPENSEVMKLISSNKKQKNSNWEPKFNGKGLNLGLIKTLHWYKKIETIIQALILLFNNVSKK